MVATIVYGPSAATTPTTTIIVIADQPTGNTIDEVIVVGRSAWGAPTPLARCAGSGVKAGLLPAPLELREAPASPPQRTRGAAPKRPRSTPWPVSLRAWK